MKQQEADALSSLLKPGIGESPLEDDVLVLPITKVQPKGERIGTDVVTWHSPPVVDGTDSVEPVLLGVYRGQTEPKKDRF